MAKTDRADLTPEQDAREVAAGQVYGLVSGLVERINYVRDEREDGPPITVADMPAEASELGDLLNEYDISTLELLNEDVLGVEDGRTLLLCCGGPSCRFTLNDRGRAIVEATARYTSFGGVWYLDDLRDDIEAAAGWWTYTIGGPPHPLRQVEAWAELISDGLEAHA